MHKDIKNLQDQVLMHISMAEDMTDFDAYAYLQLLNTTAWRYIREQYDKEYKS